MKHRRRRQVLSTLVVAAVIVVVLVAGLTKIATHHDGQSSGSGVQTGAAVPAAPSKGCAAGTPAGPSGVSHGSFSSSGVVRTYRLFVPTGALAPAPGRPRPLVVDIHGYSEGADLHASFSQWEAEAAKVGAVVLTPQGQGTIGFWNLGLSGKGIDDVTTIGDLLDRTSSAICIDTNRIYVDGFSNGAMLTSVLACRMSDRIAAFGAVSGLFDPKGCKPGRPVPIVTFHGTADPFLSWEGGTGPAAAKLPVSAASADALGGFVFGPVVATTVAWAQRDGCEGRGVPVRITPHVTRTDFDRCRGGADVVLYTEEGAGHTWPGSKAMDAVVSVTGPVNHEISATALLWKFFVAHPLPTR